MTQRELIVMPCLFAVGPLVLVAGIFSVVTMAASNSNNQFHTIGNVVAYGLLIGGAVMIRTAFGIMFKELISLRQMLEAKAKELQAS